ncbi:MAG: hypothetical protein DRN29_06085 [Thermoplasmata archaeon]|nr:MAG: hypothetical protein DRN29_06085 [Thermoplasmata archaeon]
MAEKVRKKLGEVLKQWGFGEIEADIFAILATKDKLTAKEISKEAGCAYSTTINSLNSLRRMGYVERTRKNRKFVYSANLDFVKIIDREINKISGLLNDLKQEIHKLGGKYKEGIKELAIKVEKALKYLEKKKNVKEGVK